MTVSYVDASNVANYFKEITTETQIPVISQDTFSLFYRVIMAAHWAHLLQDIKAVDAIPVISLETLSLDKRVSEIKERIATLKDQENHAYSRKICSLVTLAVWTTLVAAAILSGGAVGLGIAGGLAAVSALICELEYTDEVNNGTGKGAACLLYTILGW